MAPPLFSLREESLGDRARVIDVRGDLDASTTELMTTAINQAIAAGATHVVVDLSETTFLDSTALAGLLRCARLLRGPGRALVLVASHHGQPGGRLTITGTGDVLNVCESREEAIALIDRPSAPLSRHVVSFSLYVDGSSANAGRAIEAVTQLRRRYLPEAEIDIIDISDDPDLAERERLLASPMLVRTSPAPVRRIVGDLSDHDQVLHALGLDHARAQTT